MNTFINKYQSTAPGDAAPDNWVEKYAPRVTQPYLRLMRADRPIGSWLLLIPCWQGLALAATQQETAAIGHMIVMAVLFTIGAFVMRGAGCAYNDIVDQDFDARVERTAGRPIPSGQISTRQAWAFLFGLCLIGLSVLMQFNRFTIMLGVSSLALVAVYPFAKRVTWWPQAWLGLTFNWGALMGYAAVTGELGVASFCLYGAGIAWTLGYDTIYAHQDKEDDALIGVKSSARRLGRNSKPAIAAFYAITIALFAAIGVMEKFPWTYFVALCAPAAHFFWQVRTTDIDDSARCLRIFKSNRDAGLLLLAALLLALVRW
ncbi:MAG: 4-hydroxybenzoate octaprenyltransferase [Parvularculaceae bacterium]